MNLSEQFIRQIAEHFPQPPLAYELLAELGRPFPVLAAPPPKRGRMGDCYVNATRLTLKPGLTYCEGYAIHRRAGFPVEHAWCINAVGEVLDPTWGDDGEHYFGMAFAPVPLAAMLLKIRYHGVLCNLFYLRDLGIDGVRTLIREAASPYHHHTKEPHV